LEPLHQFKTEVRQSSIAGAGLGVFLTYDGAKVVSHYNSSVTAVFHAHALFNIVKASSQSKIVKANGKTRAIRFVNSSPIISRRPVQ
jgi:hypothetical protein